MIDGMNMKKWASMFLTAIALHTTPGIQKTQAQTADQIVMTVDSLDSIPALKLSPQQLEIVALEQINQTRALYNKAPLQLDTNLSAIAQEYANKQIFDHTPVDLEIRMESAWYNYTYASENISDISHAPSATIPLIISRQSESFFHRKNLLSEKASYVGIGFCEGIIVIIFAKN